MIKAIAGEPLVHFLLLSMALFVIYSHLDIGRDDAEAKSIVVDREKLSTYLYYRTGALQVDGSNPLDHAPESELQKIVKDYVRDEVLYREAKALQLDKGDYLARLRLIQQLEFTLRGFAEDKEITDEDIESYYRSHYSDFYVPPKVSFSHIFFSSNKHTESEARNLAQRELIDLNRSRVSADQAPGYGERFLYNINYIDAGSSRVASDFGEEFQKVIFSLSSDSSTWQGPFQSGYGFHLVLLHRREDGYQAPLGSVQVRVKQAVREARLKKQFDQSVRALVDSYKVTVNVGAQIH